MKTILLGLCLVSTAGAATFQGTLFTGAALRQELTLEEGHQEGCVQETTSTAVYHKCAIQGGKITVDREVYHLRKVLIASYKDSIIVHYYRGDRLIQIGGRDVTQAVKVTLSRDPKDATHVSGFIDLLDLQVRSAFEAYSTKN